MISRSRLICGVLFLSLTKFMGPASAASHESTTSTLRWDEGRPGCTFSADEDGKYRYGLWTDDLGVIMAIDADEVRKTSLRVEPLLAVFLTVRYRGIDSVVVYPRKISLEFVQHYRTEQMAIDPEEVAAKLKHDLPAFTAKVEKEISGHPERKTQEEALLQDHEKAVVETSEFLTSRSLRGGRLGTNHSEMSGWVFFSAKSKWVGDWKKQEQFVLRVPIANRVIEFSFALPPSRGDLLLRER